MPISGGKYVAPTWNNGSSPAINAAELQAISDTLAAVQTRAKVEVVSYTGTGTFGSSNPCSITFSTAPDYVMAIDTGAYQLFMGNGCTFWMKPSLLSSSYQRYRGFQYASNTASTYAKATNSGKTISWYSDGSAYLQLNAASTTYYFMGITGVTAP